MYSEIVPRTMPLSEMMARRPAGIILSGGPASVHADDALDVDPAVLEAGVPVLGICYGAQLLARDLGGEVRRTGTGEYGRTPLARVGRASVLLDELPDEQIVWMSHGDAITAPPPGFTVTASTPDAPVAVARGSRAGALRRAVPPRGRAHRARPGGTRAVPLRGLRLPAVVDEHVDHRRSRWTRSATRSATRV